MPNKAVVYITDVNTSLITVSTIDCMGVSEVSVGGKNAERLAAGQQTERKNSSHNIPKL